MNFEEFKNIADSDNLTKTIELIQNTEIEKLVSTLQSHNLFEFAIEYAKVVSLFTGASVQTVRNPDEFDSTKTMNWREIIQTNRVSRILSSRSKDPKVKKPWNLMHHPEHEDYMKANYLMIKLANTAMPSNSQDESVGSLYRGLHGLPPQIFLDLCKPGETYEIGTIASATSNQQTAMFFTQGDAQERATIRYRICYIIENKKYKGSPLKQASVYNNEAEVVIGGQMKTKNFAFGPDLSDFDQKDTNDFPKKITDFETLVGFVEKTENLIKHYIKKGYYGKIFDLGVAYVMVDLL